MHTIKKILHWIKKLSLTYKVVGIVAVAAVAVGGLHWLGSSSVSSATTPDTTHVVLASVASLSDQSGPLPVTGKVSSVSKASILAVSSGEIVSLTRQLGDHVSAGSIIASFENSSQRAAVLQAQGAYEGAQAALAKASGSTAQNSGLSSAQAAAAAQNAAVAANSALRSAFSSLDDAVHTRADVLFSNPHTFQPQLNLKISDSQLVVDIQNVRVTLDPLIRSVGEYGTQTNDPNLDSTITDVIAKAQTIESFLTKLAQAVNVAIPSPDTSATTIATYQASITAARSEVAAAVSSLTSAKSTYDSAITSAATAANSANVGTTNDIAAAQANVKSTLGALNAAQANLEKTIIRAPISGTIVSLALTRGGYVSSFTQVAQISNPGALNIEAYVTSDDAKTIAVGGKATIEGKTSGVIVFIAPALDPTTGKIQVKIGIPGDQSALTDGDSVAVTLERSAAKGKGALQKKEITIPISAAKITPTGPVVFTVSSSTLVANPVVFGTILGGQVTITQGLTPDMDIVRDARGLSEGEIVIVDSE